jgi:hypothetical protein
MVLCRVDPEQGVPLPLPQVRLRLHRHQQGGGAPETAPEAGLDPGRRLREVHPEPALSSAQLPAQRQADPLPLSVLSVRRAGAGPDVRAQVPTHGRLSRTTRFCSTLYIFVHFARLYRVCK